METLISYLTICVILVTGAFPINVPVMALAYKVRHGHPPIPLETKELWLRSAIAALGLFMLGVVLAGLNYLVIGVLQVPEMAAQLGLLLFFFPGAAYFLFWAFADEEPLQGLSLLVIYIFLPGIPLILADQIGGFLEGYRQVATWF